MDALQVLVIIMRGLSGSGKSTWLKENLAWAAICSADRYMVDENGEYKFDPDRLSLAHSNCLKRFMALVASGEHSIVAVDNTNTALHEVSPYYNIAQAFGCKIEVVRCFCTPQAAIVRNVHGTPEDVIYNQYARFQPGLPWWKERVIIT